MMNSNKFPKNDKKHNMETRNENVFKVDFANKSRLQKSPIIFMQNLLNENQPKETQKTPQKLNIGKIDIKQ